MGRTKLGAGVIDEDTIEDKDGDTRIRVEASIDEDIIRFDTAGSEKMVIQSDGKVGIGTNPSHLLDINGDIRIRGNDIRDNSGNSAITFDGSTNTTMNADAAVRGYLALNCYQQDNSTSKVDPPLFQGHAHIYSKVVSGHAEIFVSDSNQNVTQISPHNEEGEWHYFSRNTRTGKVVRVNMEKMIRKLEEITGESFMEEWYEEV